MISRSLFLRPSLSTLSDSPPGMTSLGGPSTVTATATMDLISLSLSLLPLCLVRFPVAHFCITRSPAGPRPEPPTGP